MKPLDMIGGSAALETIVDAFYHRVIGDEELAPFFADTDMRRMRAKQKGFLLMALGSPVLYTGRDLDEAHARLRAQGMGPQHVEKVIRLVINILEGASVPVQIIDHVRTVLEASKRAVLGMESGMKGSLAAADQDASNLRESCQKATGVFLARVRQDPELKSFFNSREASDLSALFAPPRSSSLQTMILEIVARARGDETAYTEADYGNQHSWLVDAGLNAHLYNRTIDHLIAALAEVGLKPDLLARVGATARALRSNMLAKGDPTASDLVRVEETVASSLEQYLRLTEKKGGLTLYRGHADAHRWPLTPGLGRLAGPNSALSLGRFGSWHELEDYILTRFQRHAAQYPPNLPTTKIDWLVLGQHHGLPTRLLDWTENPLVALYFALEQNLQTESSVWVMEPRYVYSIDIDFEKINHIEVYFPKAIDQRIVSQRGCFSVQPLPDGCSPFVPIDENQELINEGLSRLSRIVIPNCRHTKARMMAQINRLGIDGNFIYPGLDGLGRQITTDILADVIRM
ncbi:FRG domain-containing protein [Methylocystis sp.]|uniref:FRG domain-containing protein n=1 Tax=Methylocystis sp. TaxID=1911079 RepID=UPI003D10D094